MQVAFPSTNGSSEALVCGDGCPKATQANSVVACGHMYLDGGEELEVGAARDNYISFFAETSSGVRILLCFMPQDVCDGCTSVLRYWAGDALPG